MDTDLHSPTPPRAPRPFVRWTWALIKEVAGEYRKDGIGDVAASITFWTILSIPAAILALVSTLSSLDSLVGASLAEEVEAEVQTFVVNTFADSAALAETVSELFARSSTGVATVATLVAIFTLSRAFAGLIRSLDIAYDVEENRPWWFVRLVAIALGIGTILVVAVGATLLAVLPSLPFHSVVRLVAAPAVLVGLVLWAATIFHVGPHHRTPWRYDLPGAVLTMIGWVAASQGFALYIRASGQGNRVQTGVGGVLLALSLMYLLSTVLLVGAELNDVLARRAGVVQDVVSLEERARSWRRTVRAARR